jgi:hypothetical protein
MDFRQYEKVIGAQVEEFENEYMAWSKFHTLTDLEQVRFVDLNHYPTQWGSRSVFTTLYIIS